MTVSSMASIAHLRDVAIACAPHAGAHEMGMSSAGEGLRAPGCGCCRMWPWGGRQL